MAVKKDWIDTAIRRICIAVNDMGPRALEQEREAVFAKIIESACPFERNATYVKVVPTKPGHVHDWASKAAEYICGEGKQRPDRVAAVIAHFAEPLVALLRASTRAHHGGYQDENSDESPCPKYNDEFNDDEKCTCGADEWNAKIDAVLDGKGEPSDFDALAEHHHATEALLTRTQAHSATLVELLRAARRAHRHDAHPGEYVRRACCPCCDCGEAPSGSCNCGASEWNAKIEAAIKASEELDPGRCGLPEPGAKEPA